jgi:hypothetical protein
LGNYSHYLIYAASSLAEQSYPLALLIDDSDASVSSIRFHGQEPRDYSLGTFFRIQKPRGRAVALFSLLLSYIS